MYRLVKETNNLCGDKEYIIEKKLTFLFWSWWSRCYTGLSSYKYDDLSPALKMLELLNKKQPFITKEIIA